MYSVRDENGVMKAQLSNPIGHELILTSLGTKKMLKYKNGTEKMGFIMAEDKVFSFNAGKIFFWVGDRVIYEG